MERQNGLIGSTICAFAWSSMWYWMMEYGYTGIGEQTKVWYLLAGIKTSALTPCIASLMATPDIQNSFDQTAGAIKDFINHMKSNSSGQDCDVTVGSVASNVKSGSCNCFTLNKGQSTDGQHVKPDVAVEDQHYSQQEYVGLLAAQKYVLDHPERAIKALSLELLMGKDSSEFEVDELPSESSADEAQAQKKQPAKKQKIGIKMNQSSKWWHSMNTVRL
jgi:hypothetical protein